MRRLLEDFAVLFDLDHRVEGVSIGALLERAVAEMDRPVPTWGTEGNREEVVAESGRFVRFYYRPHLFPGMDLKLRLAHELQYRMLPQSLPRDSPVSVSAVLESYCHLSGDLFGWEMLKSGKLLIWIADMAGHGIRAGLASAVLRVLIEHLQGRDRISELAGRLNRALCESVRREHDSLYATLFLMTLDGEGSAAYCSAGHPPTLVRGVDGSVVDLQPLDLPIGLFGDTTYATREFTLQPGERLLMYTDGLVEAKGWDGEFFGRERLYDLLGNSTGDSRTLTQSIYQEIQRRQDIDKLEDDVTFLAIERAQGSTAVSPG